MTSLTSTLPLDYYDVHDLPIHEINVPLGAECNFTLCYEDNKLYEVLYWGSSVKCNTPPGEYSIYS